MRITFIASSDRIFLFQFNCIKNIISVLEKVSIDVFITNDNWLENKEGVDKTFGKIDQRLCSFNQDPYDEIDLEGLGDLSINIITDFNALRSCDLIVFLYPVQDTCLFKKYAGNGLIRFNYNLKYYYSQAVNKEPYTKISIEFCELSSDNWCEVDAMQLKTEFGVINNRNKALLCYSVLLNRCLLGKFFSKEEPLALDPIVNYSKVTLISYYFYLFFFLLKRKFVSKENNWKIAIKEGSNKVLFIEQPEGSFWADPFIIQNKLGIFVFFEELNRETSLGQLSVLEICKDGIVLNKQVVVKQNYHLSFPNVFLYKGMYYMIPETSENNNLLLFKCINFPYKWDLEMTLIKDTKLVDVIWIYRDGLYWLFGNKIEEFEKDNNERLNLYFSKELVSNDWIAHPCNPIVVDIQRARNAGQIFFKGNKLFRPSQNCMLSYGHNIVINEIVELSTTAYREEEVQKVMAEDGYVGIHTLNADKDFQVFDFLKSESVKI